MALLTGRVLLLAAMALLVLAPASEASCHGCIDAVVDSCSAGDTDACAASTRTLAEHYPQHALDTVEDVLEP